MQNNTAIAYAARTRRKKAKRNAGSVAMSPGTREFLQKFCFREAASVDMTQHGFICDSKVLHVNLLLKPLKEKIGEICGPPDTRKNRENKEQPARTSTFEVPSALVKSCTSEDAAKRRIKKKTCKVKFNISNT